jgi:hypothetical protein
MLSRLSFPDPRRFLFLSLALHHERTLWAGSIHLSAWLFCFSPVYILFHSFEWAFHSLG